MENSPFEIAVAGKTLHGHLYPCPKPRAVVLIVHGMGEYGRRYERAVIPELLKNNLSVLVYDQFGHGSNTGKRGHHPGYEYLLESIDKCLEIAKSTFQDLPVFLYGHSMGGNVVLNYAISRPSKIKGAVVTSPFLRLAFEPPAWKLALGKLLGQLLPSVTLANEIDASSISQIEEEVEAYRNDPLIHDRVSPAYSIVVMEKGEHVIKRASEISLPVLLLHGSSDRLTDPGASRELARKAEGQVEYVEVEGGYHELHHDLKRQEVIKHIIEWIGRFARDGQTGRQNKD